MAEEHLTGNSMPKQRCYIKWTKDSIATELKRLANKEGQVQSQWCSRYVQRKILYFFKTFDAACEYSKLIPYYRLNRGKVEKLCSIDGCGKTTTTHKGKYCLVHYSRIKRNGTIERKNGKYYIENEEIFDVITSDIAWVMGLIWTDGNLYRNRITIASKDLEMLEQAAAITGGKIKQRKSKKCYDLIIVSNHAKNTLVKYGLCEAKSFIIKWPKTMPIIHNGSFIRGVIDGDGSVYLERRYSKRGTYIPTLHVYIYSAYSDFVSELVKVLSSHNIHCGVYWGKGKNVNVAHMSIYDHKSLHNLYDLIHGNSEPSLKRKKDKFHEWIITPRNYVNKNRKLIWDNIESIRKEFSENGRIEIKKQALKYNVTINTIRNIVTGKTWVSSK